MKTKEARLVINLSHGNKCIDFLCRYFASTFSVFFILIAILLIPSCANEKEYKLEPVSEETTTYLQSIGSTSNELAVIPNTCINPFLVYVEYKNQSDDFKTWKKNSREERLTFKENKIHCYYGRKELVDELKAQPEDPYLDEIASYFHYAKYGKNIQDVELMEMIVNWNTDSVALQKNEYAFLCARYFYDYSENSDTKFVNNVIYNINEDSVTLEHKSIITDHNYLVFYDSVDLCYGSKRINDFNPYKYLFRGFEHTNVNGIEIVNTSIPARLYDKYSNDFYIELEPCIIDKNNSNNGYDFTFDYYKLVELFEFLES